MMKSNLMPEHRLILIPANPGNSTCLTFLAQVMAKSTENFGMTFAKNVTYHLKFVGREMNRHSGKT